VVCPIETTRSTELSFHLQERNLCLSYRSVPGIGALLWLPFDIIWSFGNAFFVREETSQYIAQHSSRNCSVLAREMRSSSIFHCSLMAEDVLYHVTMGNIRDAELWSIDAGAKRK
jgi:hypothetical protein